MESIVSGKITTNNRNNLKNNKNGVCKNNTLNYIFNMSETDIFNNEMQNLIEEIDNNNVQHCKIPILINYIHYKLSELINHQNIANTLLASERGRKNKLNKLCKKENFIQVENFIKNNLLTKVIEMERFSLDLIKTMLLPDNN